MHTIFYFKETWFFVPAVLAPSCRCHWCYRSLNHTYKQISAKKSAQLTGVVEYTNCISTEGFSLLDRTINCIWWWGSSLGALVNVEYFFIAITPRSTLNHSGSRIPSIGVIELVSCVWHENIWWWGSCPGALGNVEYFYIAITQRSTLTHSGSRIPSIGVIELVSWIWHKTIRWWGSSPGALGNVEYFYIAITPRSTLTWSDITF